MGRSNKTAGLRTEQMDNWSRRREGQPSYKSDAAHQTKSYHVLDFHDPGQYKDKSVGVVVVAGVMLAVAVWSSVVWFVTSRFGEGKPQVPGRQKKVFRSSVHEAPYQTDARTPVENPKANPCIYVHRGGVPETVAQLAPWLMNHGSDTHSGLKPYVCEDDGCQRAYCGRSSLQQHMKRVEFKSWLEFQPKTRIEVSERQAKTCLRPLRYNGGTCNGCTDATFESETKDVFMNARHARMRTAVLLSNPIDELWQYTQRLVAVCVFRGLLSACLVIAATAYEDVLINLGFGSRASWK
ncbi:hypothetical protein T4C_1563 [Trichinella pseudospiralis]|uniref:C2H2-type domain-containing protein n=1 Tax=Trichinella pseudospiralis TaxID=6337 RepID=A0A0V1JYM1_TRIPS|nr:hypothetical protein T4C_1563 [Trichinella pseudospiralis]